MQSDSLIIKTGRNMILGNYQFSCLFEDDALLPSFKGSTFRGVFGRALKNVVCALKRQECDQCLLRQKCLYALVFETSKSIESTKGARVAGPPHPFVIEPPLDTRTHFQKMDPFEFRLLVFGEINNHLPYFIYAFDQMGRIGIGKKSDGKRGHFTLEQVSAEGHPIYSSADHKLTTPTAFQGIDLKYPKNIPDEPFKLHVKMITPLRLKFENRLKADLPFHVLVRATLRRVSTLMEHYGEGEPDLDYRGLVNRAKKVEIIEDNLGWHDWQRYSFRQDMAMLMGGMLGSITYEGNIGEFMPLINFCSNVHIGKQTTFGLGKFEMDIIS